jgi:hypothetical protein
MAMPRRPCWSAPAACCGARAPPSACPRSTSTAPSWPSPIALGTPAASRPASPARPTPTSGRQSPRGPSSCSPPASYGAAGRAGEALALAARYDLPEAAAAHHAIALVHELAGHTNAAQQAIAAAVADAEGLRARLPLDDLLLGFLETREPIYRDAVRLAARGGDPAETLAAINLAFSAPLPRPGLPPGDPDLQARLRELRERWAYLQSSLDSVEGEPGAAQALARERKGLERAIADVTRRLAVGLHPTPDAQHPIPDPRPPTPDALLLSLQACLGPDDALLVYAPAGPRALAISVTSEAICQHQLPVESAGIERLLRSWRFHVEHAYGVAAEAVAHAGARALLARLHGALVAPLASTLSRSRHLIVSLPPEWHDLPLAATLGPDGHLIASHDLSFVSAPEALTRRAAPPLRGPAMVLGCSDGGRLPAALHEARAVAAALGATGPVRPLIEDEATAAAVAEALPNCGVAHFATHAAFRHDNPLFSWVRLADGHLALADLGELSLRGQPLVVLSACESGRGRPRGGGIVGMARGFLLAGAATLVTSLWKIADDSSAQLMADFYRALASGTAPSALAEAQRQAIARGEHPFHWAAFVCVEA